MKRRTRRWGRILFNTLTAISLLLAIATAGLWVRSKHTSDLLSVDTRTATYCVVTESGSVAFFHFAYVDIFRVGERERELQHLSSQRQHLIEGLAETKVGHTWSWMGFRWDRLALDDRRVVLPLWFVFVLAVLAPIAWLRTRVLTIRRARPGLCPACGYDTRANSAKCSECGHEIASGG